MAIRGRIREEICGGGRGRLGGAAASPGSEARGERGSARASGRSS